MAKLILLMISLPMFSSLWQQKPLPLEKRITITFYAAEILESVANRVGLESRQTIIFNVQELLPYKAKARVYNDVTVKDILDDQLSGTPFKYRMNRKKQLEIYKPQGDGNN